MTATPNRMTTETPKLKTSGFFEYFKHNDLRTIGLRATCLKCPRGSPRGNSPRASARSSCYLVFLDKNCKNTISHTVQRYFMTIIFIWCLKSPGRGGFNTPRKMKRWGTARFPKPLPFLTKIWYDWPVFIWFTLIASVLLGSDSFFR